MTTSMTFSASSKQVQQMLFHYRGRLRRVLTCALSANRKLSSSLAGCPSRVLIGHSATRVGFFYGLHCSEARALACSTARRYNLPKAFLLGHWSLCRSVVGGTHPTGTILAI